MQDSKRKGKKQPLADILKQNMFTVIVGHNSQLICKGAQTLSSIPQKPELCSWDSGSLYFSLISDSSVLSVRGSVTIDPSL